ncbi:cysteine hydrolase family protein [Vibrio sp. 10N]|uniref:cysteine hydrolase family protein n=1 Tax=Vibrio sp. 10N TaxID=3058938 RepID=UPI002812983B|nr:cysteine hydrolase family protein [Vibrio sp. 10N]
MTNHHTALLLIDIQNDYFEGGQLPLNNPKTAADNASAILNAFRQQNWPVIHIQHENLDASKPFLLKDSAGQQLHESVTPLHSEVVISKHFPNAFWKTALESVLQSMQVNHLVVVGMMTHMCVSTTSRAAMERGFKVFVVDDACATRSLQYNGKEIDATTVHNTALAELQMIADVHRTDSILRYVV